MVPRRLLPWLIPLSFACSSDIPYRLDPFESCAEIWTTLTADRLSEKGLGGSEQVLDGAVADPLAPVPPGAPDLTTARGNFLYTFLNEDPLVLSVLRGSPAADAALLQTVTFSKTDPKAVFVTSDRAVVVGGKEAESAVSDPVTTLATPTDPVVLPATPKTHLYYFGRGSNGKLTLDGSRIVDGRFRAARLVGGRLHLVLSLEFPLDLDVDLDEDAGADAIELTLPATQFDGVKTALTTCDAVLREEALIGEGAAPRQGTLVCGVSVDTSDASATPSALCAVAFPGSTVLASDERFFVASAGWDGVTPIHQFGWSTDGSAPVYAGTAAVPGYLLNEKAIDESGGHLRVAFSGRGFSAEERLDDPAQAEGDGASGLRLFRLGDGAPEETGGLDDLGAGRGVYSVRFLGSRAFAVPFEPLDPLALLDLSEPGKPRRGGDLAVPGLGTAMFEGEDGILLGLGKGAGAASDADLSWTKGIGLSVFDASDPAAPELKRKLAVGSSGTTSEALRDPRAVTYDAASGLLIFPLDLFGGSDPGSHAFAGFHIYEASASALRRVGMSAFPTGGCEDCAVGRSFVQDGGLSLVGGGELVTRTVSDPAADVQRISLD
jgi:hypothetical protein